MGKAKEGNRERNPISPHSTGGGGEINITRPAYDVRVFRSHNTDPFLRGATFYNRAWRQVITCFWCLARSFALRPPTPSHARDRARSP